MKNPLFNYPRPKGLEAFILRNADNYYLIYDRNGGFCTAENHMCPYFDYEVHKHSERHECRYCSQIVTSLNKRYRRKSRAEYGRILWFRKQGRITFAQLDEYIIDYESGRPEVTYWPSAQYKLSRDEQIYYKHLPETCWLNEKWEFRKNFLLPAPWAYANMYSSRWNKTLIYDDHIEFGTDLRYAEPYRTDNPYNLMQYLYMFLKWPSIELLDKAGFRKIVNCRIRGETSRYINWRAKTIRGVFKATRDELQQIRDIGIFSFDKWKTLRSYGLDIMPKQTDVVGWCDIGVTVIKMQNFGLDINTALKYMMRQNEKSGRHNTLGDYVDYIEDCIKLQLDVSNRRIARPKDFREEHERLSKMIKVKADEMKTEQFARAELEITQMTEPYVVGGLLIRPAATPAELMTESEKLQHCVRTYVDRVCRKESAILFVRDEKQPEEPLYTLELSPAHNIVQVRGLKNIDPPPEVMQIVYTWKGELYGI